MTKSFYKEIIVETTDNVYEPREDSYLLAEVIEKCISESVNRLISALDVGTGSGLQAIIAAKAGAKVTATDINPEAIECAKKNATANNVKIIFKQGDLFQALGAAGRREGGAAKNRTSNLIPQTSRPLFDLIIFNAPYLPDNSAIGDNEKIDKTYAGAGKITEFLAQYRKYLKPNGFALLVYSSLSGVKVPGEIIARKKLDFEEIFVAKL